MCHCEERFTATKQSLQRLLRPVRFARNNTNLGNNKQICSLQSQTGAILLVVLILMLTVSLLGATLVSLYFNVLSAGQVELYRAQALYLSEGGLAQAITFLKSQAEGGSALEPEKIIPSTPLGEGTYEVYNDFSQSTIVSIGQSHSVKRSIQLKYGAF